MRTTVNLEDDVLAAVEKSRAEHGTGISETVNELIRKGLTVGDAARRFEQRSVPLGLKLDVSNVAEALENLDGPRSR